MEVVQDFIPRFWSNLAYLGQLTCKSSGGRLPCKSSTKKIVLFSNCKTNLRRLTWKLSRYNKILNFWFSTRRQESQISDTIRSITKLTCLSQTTSSLGFSRFFFKQKYVNIYKGRLPKKSAVETTSLEVVLCKILIAKRPKWTTSTEFYQKISVDVVYINV